MSAAPSLSQIFACFFRLGVTAYGGPAMLPHIRRVVVERRQWLSPESFRLGLSLCQAIPGGTLMQLAAYTGLTLRGLPGALAGFVGFALPAATLITTLAALYYRFQSAAQTRSLMTGLSVVVLAIILLAVIDFWRKYARGSRRILFTLAAAGLFLAGVGPAWIILGAALAGPLAFPRPDAPPTVLPCLRVGWRPLAGLVLLAAGWLLFARLFVPTLFDLSLSMAKIDLFAFGGYGAFPVMYHEVVDLRGWMDADQFLDGMALAQVTPGPILLASCFVGYHLHGLVGALAGAVWIFTPSFLLLMAAVRFCGGLIGSQLFQRALTGVLSTLGGLILAVGVTLARSMDWTPLKAALWALALLALWRRVDPLWVVLAGALAGLFLL